jgi:ribosomal protein S18 acetylase RimI-like enzyme
MPVKGDPTSIDAHQVTLAAELLWVACGEYNLPLGFLGAERFGQELHIAELSVQLDCQQQGIGRRLVATVVHHARSLSLSAITLTTFRDVAWNAPFYVKLGFEVVPERTMSGRLHQKVMEEDQRGLKKEQRCAMQYTINS